ncbi:MFS transporter [Anatilimnocola aggregata]|nr:MFS transporter [Anatilimnocola aggregata]
MDETTSAEPPPQPTRVRWLILLLSCGASFLLYLHRYTWNFVNPKLQGQFNLSHSQTEFLFSLFYYTYAAGQIPSGMIIDRFGPRWFLTFSILFWSLAMAALVGVSWLLGGGSSTGNLTMVIVLIGGARLLFGAAQAGCYPALTKASKVWFSPVGRTALQGLIASTAGRSGAALSSIIFGTIMMGWLGLSWQTGLLILSAVGLLYGLLFWLGYGDSPAADARVNEAERIIIRGPEELTPANAATQPAMLPWGNALRSTSLRWFICQQFCDAGSDVAFVSLIGKYFLQSRGLDLSQTGILAALPLIGGALGGLAGGALNEVSIHLSGSRRWGRSGVGFVGKVVGCLMLLTVTQQESATVAAFMLMFAKFFGDWSQPTVWGTCTDMGGRYSATVFSIINTSGTVGGVVMPLVFGRLLDVFTREVLVDDKLTKITSWDPLFYLLAGMYLASGLCWLMVDCTKSLENVAAAK